MFIVGGSSVSENRPVIPSFWPAEYVWEVSYHGPFSFCQLNMICHADGYVG